MSDFFGDLKKDYSDVEAAKDGKYETLPEGDYIAKLNKDYTFGYSSNKGTPQLAGMFNILTGPFKGRKIFKTWYFTEKALPYVLRDFSILSGDKITVNNLEDAALDTNPVKLADCEHITYKGKIRLDCGWINELEAEELSALEEILTTEERDSF